MEDCECTSWCVRGGRQMRDGSRAPVKNKHKTQKVRQKVLKLTMNKHSCRCNSHPPWCVTSFCCTVCRSWRRCWTRATESAAGTGPVGTASEGWSRGSGWPGLNRCAGYSQWDRKLRKKCSSMRMKCKNKRSTKQSASSFPASTKGYNIVQGG